MEEKLLQKFRDMPPEDKKKKLLNIFEFIKDKIDFSDNAINYLNDEEADENVMIKLYEFVLAMTTSAKNRKQKEREASQEKQQEIMKQLSEESNQSAESDQKDADDLLDLMNVL